MNDSNGTRTDGRAADGSGDPPIVQGPWWPKAEPVTVRHGDARVSVLAGGRPEVTLVFGHNAEHFAFTDAGSARDLYACLHELYGAPVAEDARALVGAA